MLAVVAVSHHPTIHWGYKSSPTVLAVKWWCDVQNPQFRWDICLTQPLIHFRAQTRSRRGFWSESSRDVWSIGLQFLECHRSLRLPWLKFQGCNPSLEATATVGKASDPVGRFPPQILASKTREVPPFREVRFHLQSKHVFFKSPGKSWGKWVVNWLTLSLLILRYKLSQLIF